MLTSWRQCLITICRCHNCAGETPPATAGRMPALPKRRALPHTAAGGPPFPVLISSRPETQWVPHPSHTLRRVGVWNLDERSFKTQAGSLPQQELQP